MKAPPYPPIDGFEGDLKIEVLNYPSCDGMLIESQQPTMCIHDAGWGEDINQPSRCAAAKNTLLVLWNSTWVVIFSALAKYAQAKLATR